MDDPEFVDERGDWPNAHLQPDFFIVDDQYNDERYLYVSVCDKACFTLEWVLDLLQTLRDLPGWGVCITNVENGYLILFSERIMVTGKTFSCCNNLLQLVERARTSLILPPFRSSE
jgi:hypothetical protein